MDREERIKARSKKLQQEQQMNNESAQALTAAIVALQQYLKDQVAVDKVKAKPSTPVYDLYDDTNPFDLATRTGLSAFEASCLALDAKWDGSPETWPAFLLALRDRADECAWDMAGDTGITKWTVGTKSINILENYHDVTEKMILDAYTKRTNDRAKQNAKAMYKAIKNSLTGDAKTFIFDTPGNSPANKDGIELLYKLTKLTILSSIQLSIKATGDMQAYDPSSREYDIPLIFKDIAKYFILINTGQRKLEDPEKIMWALSVLNKIKQPSEFVRFIERQQEAFDCGSLTIYKNFTNAVVFEYHKIKDKAGFKGSLQTQQEEIVAMFANARSSRPRNTSSNADRNSSNQDSDTTTPNGPPFLKHTTLNGRDGASEYKVGDTKTWNKTVWHYCDCPNHRERAHWHKFPTAECRTRQRWLKKLEDGDSKPTANVVTPPDDDKDNNTLITASTGDLSSLTDASDPKALLVAALSAVGSDADGDLPRELIAVWYGP